MRWVGLVVLVIVVALVLHRLLLAAERRGWIYYRRKASSGSVSGAAFGPVFDLLQPSRQIQVEEQQHQELLREDDEAGEGDVPG